MGNRQAKKLYESSRVEQDKNYVSDFDELAEKSKKLERRISHKKKNREKRKN